MIPYLCNMFTKIPNEALRRLDIESFKKAEKFPIIIVLDNIRSMQNIGSMFRTGDAFRVEEILLCGITACPPHREIQRAALDATESVSWQYFETTRQALEYLKSKGYTIYAVEQASPAVALQDLRVSEGQKAAFVFGNEVDGVDERLFDLVDACIEIPQFGTKHSFNVAVSLGIVLWGLYEKWLR